jgi:hypothetical protein
MADFPKQLQELVERFDRNFEAYTNQVYNETQVRRDFIDPFFEAATFKKTQFQTPHPVVRFSAAGKPRSYLSLAAKIVRLCSLACHALVV